MAIDRWEWLEGLKAESPIDVAVKYVAALTADALAAWPPAISAVEGQEGSRFRDVLEPGAERPSLAAYEEAIKRARWELLRDYDAIDFYARNNHIVEACPAKRDQLASEFIQHYVLESFFVLMEKTEYRVKRKDVLPGLAMIDKRVKLVWFETIVQRN
ncbi:MAG: hypothetical protein GY811_03840 [Myxococcales bacterium]|nr:hypothetical protein [Myxococcales bacterium]